MIKTRKTTFYDDPYRRKVVFSMILYNESKIETSKIVILEKN